MKAKIYLAAIFLLVHTPFLFAQEATRTNSKQLIDNMEKFDKSNVLYKGEVIGDIMKRGNAAWFNVQDELNVIGVWAPQEVAGVLTQAGDYQHQGDIIEVDGKFLRSDPELKGEFCIRANKISVLKPGYQIFRVLKPIKEEIALTLSLVALALAGTAMYFIKKRQNRKFET